MFEDIMCDLSVLFGCGSAKFVKVAAEPLVYFGMYFVIVVTYLLGRLILITSFRFRSCSVFVCTTNVEDVVAC